MPEIPNLYKIPGIIKIFCPLKKREKANIFINKMQNIDSVRGSFLTHEMKGSLDSHSLSQHKFL